MNDVPFIAGFVIFALGVALGALLTLIMVAVYWQYRDPWRRHERERQRDEIRIRQWSPSKPLPPTPRPKEFQ